MKRRWLVGSVALSVFAATSVAASARLGDHYQVRYNAADQRAARAVMLNPYRLAGLGAAPWMGGPQKVTREDVTSTPCHHYTPKEADLVLTGAAKAAYVQRGENTIEKTVSRAGSLAFVFQSADMLRRDWLRTPKPADLASCLAASLRRSLPSNAKLVSFKQIPIPHPRVQYAIAFEGVIHAWINSQGSRLRVLDTAYAILGARPETRTELGLFVILASPPLTAWAEGLLEGCFNV